MVGFIQFLALQEDIVKAMGLTGQLLMGQAVMVKSAEVLPACWVVCQLLQQCQKDLSLKFDFFDCKP